MQQITTSNPDHNRKFYCDVLGVQPKAFKDFAAKIVSLTYAIDLEHDVYSPEVTQSIRTAVTALVPFVLKTSIKAFERSVVDQGHAVVPAGADNPISELQELVDECFIWESCVFKGWAQISGGEPRPEPIHTGAYEKLDLTVDTPTAVSNGLLQYLVGHAGAADFIEHLMSALVILQQPGPMPPMYPQNLASLLRAISMCHSLQEFNWGDLKVASTAAAVVAVGSKCLDIAWPRVGLSDAVTTMFPYDPPPVLADAHLMADDAKKYLVGMYPWVNSPLNGWNSAVACLEYKKDSLPTFWFKGKSVEKMDGADWAACVSQHWADGQHRNLIKTLSNGGGGGPAVKAGKKKKETKKSESFKFDLADDWYWRQGRDE